MAEKHDERVTHRHHGPAQSSDPLNRQQTVAQGASRTLARMARRHDVTLCASPVARYARQEAARLHHGGKRREAEGRKIFLSRQKRGITPTIRRELRRLTFESTDPQVGMIYHSQWHTSLIRITFLITIGWKNRNGLPPEKTFSNVIKGWHAW